MPEANRALLYNRLKRHSASKRALLVAFVWGVAEGTLFFVIPDVYVAWVALFHWPGGLRATLVSVAGSMVGGGLMYALAAQDGAAMAALLVQVPLISPQMVETVARRMEADGLRAMIGGPFGFIPYKVYAVQAGRQSLSLLLFLIMTVPARLTRILPATLTGAVFGVGLDRLVRQHTKLALMAYGWVWVGVYVFYYLQVR